MNVSVCQHAIRKPLDAFTVLLTRLVSELALSEVDTTSCVHVHAHTSVVGAFIYVGKVFLCLKFAVLVELYETPAADLELFLLLR